MLIQKIKPEKVPRHLFPYDWFVRSRSTRAQVSLPAARTVQFTKSPLFHSYSDWLKLSSLAHHCHSMSQFHQVVCTELRFRALFSSLFLSFHCFLVFFLYFYHGWLSPSSLGLLPTLAMRAHATRLSLIIITIIIIMMHRLKRASKESNADNSSPLIINICMQGFNERSLDGYAVGALARAYSFHLRIHTSSWVWGTPVCG